MIETECDIICASSSKYSYMDYPLRRKKTFAPKPFVCMGAIHFDDEQHIELDKVILERIKNSDKYIANTKFEKDCLVSLGIESSKISVIGCGVQPENFAKTTKSNARKTLGLLEESFIIGYVGRFTVSKGLVTLLDAFRHQSKPDWILVLAGGENEYLKYLYRIIDAEYTIIKSQINIIVDFDESMKEIIYSSLDVFVSPSYSESFGIVFLEAWATKLPVVGTDIGAIRTVIDHSKDGSLFPVGDAEKLGSILNTYYIHPNHRLNHGQAGYQKVLDKYTWSVITAKYRATYIEVIDKFKSKI